jgi:hypothetical protein
MMRLLMRKCGEQRLKGDLLHSADIKAIVHDVLARIDRNQHIEDSRLELKSAWPDPHRAARRIAGHANAGRGAPVLWIVGIDEKKGLVGCEVAPFHDWWAQVAGHFDAAVPALRDNSISIGTVSVIVLEFMTDHAPYVVKTAGSPVTKEVPWRSATAVRSAHRSELLTLLRPLQSLPTSEFLRGHFSAKSVRPTDADEFCQCSLQLQIVLSTTRDGRLIIPLHKCTGVVWTSFGTSVILNKVKVHAHDPNSVFVRRDQHHVVVDGSARLLVSGEAKTPNMDILIAQSIRAEVELAILDAPTPLLLTALFTLPPQGSPGWRQNWDKQKKWVISE